nr:hypothetical protein [Mesorhizobium prunaredense]
MDAKFHFVFSLHRGAGGAGCDFLTPIGHQCNTLVKGPGGYRFGDYPRLGLPLSFLVVIVAVPMLMTVWPMNLICGGRINPRETRSPMAVRRPLPVKQYASLVIKALYLSRPRILAKRDAGGV